jgi:hypothetical protein
VTTTTAWVLSVRDAGDHVRERQLADRRREGSVSGWEIDPGPAGTVPTDVYGTVQQSGARPVAADRERGWHPAVDEFDERFVVFATSSRSKARANATRARRVFIRNPLRGNCTVDATWPSSWFLPGDSALTVGLSEPGPTDVRSATCRNSGRSAVQRRG